MLSDEIETSCPGMQLDPTDTRTEQYFALLRSSEVNSEVRQSGTGEGFGNLYP